jgi:hypothetical protein
MCVTEINDENSPASPVILIVKSTRNGFHGWYRLGYSENTILGRLVTLNNQFDPPNVFTHIINIDQSLVLFNAIGLANWNTNANNPINIAMKKITKHLLQRGIPVGASNYYQTCNVPQNLHLPDNSCFCVKDPNLIEDAVKATIQELNTLAPCA